MKSNPRRLLGFKGIGEKKLGKIVKAWKKFEKTKQLAELLSPHGVSRTLIIKIFEHFGESADAEVRKNPYVLTQIDGIGFRRADEVSLKIGIRPDSTFRLLSALVFVLNESAVTRAKKRIYIVGEIPAFERGCRTLDDTNRRTVLDSLCKKEDVKVDFVSVM